MALVRLPARRDVCQNTTSKHPKVSYLQPHGESEGEEERLVKNGAEINPMKKAENVLERLEEPKLTFGIRAHS